MTPTINMQAIESIQTNWQSAIAYLGGTEENEQALIEKMGRQIHQEVNQIARQHHTAPRRPQHTKMLAGIKNAIFQISPDLMEDLNVGFLKGGQSYPATVRFSNAAAFLAADDAHDLRGVAIEISPFEGNVQDFLMTNAEQHHAKDAIQAMATSLAFSKKGFVNKITGTVQLTTRVGPKEALRILKTISKQIKIPVESIATETYWSRAPVRIGEVVLKYRLYPAIHKTEPVKSNENLVEEFKTRLEKDDIQFSFQIQRYINETLTPLEDATKSWLSPFETIADLIIPKQDLVNDDHFFSTKHFNPWKINSKEFEPVGNMNRARKIVYAASEKAQRV
ncbi:MAG TPA: hypothetical protein VII28_16455 [Puia sp.]